MTEPMSRDEALAYAGRMLATAQREGRVVPSAIIEALVSYAGELRKGEAPAEKPYWSMIGGEFVRSDEVPAARPHAVQDVEVREHWHGNSERYEVRLPGASSRWWDAGAKQWCDEG